MSCNLLKILLNILLKFNWIDHQVAQTAHKTVEHVPFLGTAAKIVADVIEAGSNLAQDVADVGNQGAQAGLDAVKAIAHGGTEALEGVAENTMSGGFFG